MGGAAQSGLTKRTRQLAFDDCAAEFQFGSSPVCGLLGDLFNAALDGETQQRVHLQVSPVAPGDSVAMTVAPGGFLHLDIPL